jgi:phospholipid/cholesterol/gamma-HCH transport system substrate-binding protein
MSDPPTYPATCTDPRAQPGYTGPDPITQRGVNMAPKVADDGGTTYRIAPYDASTGETDLGDGKTVTVTPGDGDGPLSVLKSFEALVGGVS